MNSSLLNSFKDKLICIEALPEETTAEKLPVVILCHGFAYYKEEAGIFTEVAMRLTKRGFAVYYFDFSGCGISSGDFVTLGLKESKVEGRRS